MIVTDEQVSEALNLLASTAEALGKAVGRKAAFEEKATIEREQAFLAAGENAPEMTVREREARAKTSEAYKAALREYIGACQEEATLRAKRVHAECIIKVWQTMESSRRAANV